MSKTKKDASINGAPPSASAKRLMALTDLVVEQRQLLRLNKEALSEALSSKPSRESWLLALLNQENSVLIELTARIALDSSMWGASGSGAARSGTEEAVLRERVRNQARAIQKYSSGFLGASNGQPSQGQAMILSKGVEVAGFIAKLQSELKIQGDKIDSLSNSKRELLRLNFDLSSRVLRQSFMLSSWPRSIEARTAFAQQYFDVGIRRIFAGHKELSQLDESSDEEELSSAISATAPSIAPKLHLDLSRAKQVQAIIVAKENVLSEPLAALELKNNRLSSLLEGFVSDNLLLRAKAARLEQMVKLSKLHILKIRKTADLAVFKSSKVGGLDSLLTALERTAESCEAEGTASNLLVKLGRKATQLRMDALEEEEKHPWKPKRTPLPDANKFLNRSF